MSWIKLGGYMVNTDHIAAIFDADEYWDVILCNADNNVLVRKNSAAALEIERLLKK